MITTNIPNSTSISAINAKVDIQTRSALVTCTCGDNLQEFVLHREGDSSKFFGFGISHKLDVTFIDLDRTLKKAPVEKGNTIRIALGSGDNFDYPYPTMYIAELSRNEKTSNVTCVAYDALFKANTHKVSELNINLKETIEGLWPTLTEIGERCAEVLGLSGLELVGLDDFNISNFTLFRYKANLDGSESLKELLDDIAELTQTIYYINSQNKLVFKQLDRKNNPVLTVDKNMYFELTTLTPRTISGVSHVTELGNNLTSEDTDGIIIQIIRDNAFLEVFAGIDEGRIQSLLNRAALRLSGLTFTQLECEWDGNHCLEIGDKVAFITEDNSKAIIYIINDVIEYRGFLNEITAWEYTQDEDETETNPTNIGDIINQTYSKVDKVNKEITLMASGVEETKSELAELKLNTDNIYLRVETVEQLANNKVDSVGNTLEALTKEVNLKVSAEDLTIAVNNKLNEGIDKVVTSTKKYTFDDTGLNIGSSDSSINTVITEDGMRINRSGHEVLTADNTGVKAEDLHAVTYLIIGNNSRLEDWQDNYTACFWIGD